MDGRSAFPKTYQAKHIIYSLPMIEAILILGVMSDALQAVIVTLFYQWHPDDQSRDPASTFKEGVQISNLNITQPPRLSPKGFVAVACKVYNPLSFYKGYNIILFFVFAGVLIGFTLGRFQYLNLNVFHNGSTPREYFAYQYGYQKAGLLIHFGAIFPIGYIILLLSLLGIIGALMIARGSLIGGLDIQAAVGLLSIHFIGVLVAAYAKTKRLRIGLHRAWMLRACNIGTYYAAQPYDQILSIIGDTNQTIELYPDYTTYFPGISPS
ncbi:uncharacterized protein CLUP02_18236 [Colletotrichum lupini]|uniref:Uncharacterized protein n=1 Tax=Colletotrichum lupini TaxID=145971 RepID=A0A9Q8SGZ0_9PEZI|nr:uncharacterized protein CLUP02_18236 [Colletotrichum lupini]UQC76721.1 hypothetical protein CLUP02_18236 [Colletotrichum lupini]